MTKKGRDESEVRLTDLELSEKIAVLEKLARGDGQKVAGKAQGLSDKQVRYLRDKATLCPSRSEEKLSRRLQDLLDKRAAILKSRGKPHPGTKLSSVAEQKRIHQNAMSDTASKLVSNLRFAQGRYMGLPDEAIGEIVVSGEEMSQIEKFDDYLAECLLSHVQVQLPRLNVLKHWGDLKIREIKGDLLDNLSAIAGGKKIEGKCKICESFGD
jgi:hypothetical protein